MEQLNDIVTLITDRAVTMKGNSSYEVLNKKELFASISSVKGAEYYAAMNAGIKVSCIITLDVDDYNELVIRDDKGKKHYPRLVEHDGDVYKIVRTYVKKKQYIELTVQEVV